jgi:hypothetical protein
MYNAPDRQKVTIHPNIFGIHYMGDGIVKESAGEVMKGRWGTDNSAGAGLRPHK